MKAATTTFTPGPGLEWLGLFVSGVLVRRSARARSINLRMLTTGQLEVVLPRRASSERMTALIADKRAWIERASEHARRLREMMPPAALETYPENVDLLAIGETWSVTHTAAQDGFLRVLPGKRLLVASPADDAATTHELMRRWLAAAARRHLKARLDDLSGRAGLHYNSLSIRRQKTRWGSCSQRGAISLNACLLFLPRPLADYVLIHELCHTLELNHSSAYWEVVRRYEPAYSEYEKELRTALLRYVPRWAASR